MSARAWWKGSSSRHATASPPEVILWRISEYASLDGAGGMTVEGRWHSAGRPIVYAAETSALAMLEVLVHLEIDFMPPPFQLLEIEAPDALAAAHWPGDEDFADLSATRAWGDAWLSGGEAALAKVPSAIAPNSFNWLINPAHPETSKVKLLRASRWPWDSRLFRT